MANPMERTLVDIIVLVFACSQVIETWHHGSIFASLRNWFDLPENWLSELAGCPFCLSHWIALLIAAADFTADLAKEKAWLIQLPIWALAVTRSVAWPHCGR